MSKVMCKHGERKLSAYPFILILYLETNMQSGEPKLTEYILDLQSITCYQYKDIVHIHY